MLFFGMWYIVVSVTLKWCWFVGENIRLVCWREHTTAAPGDKMCVFICLVSVGMPGGNGSMNGMLLESVKEQRRGQWLNVEDAEMEMLCMFFAWPSLAAHHSVRV